LQRGFDPEEKQMPVDGPPPVQSPSPAAAGTSDAAQGADPAAGAVNQSRVGDGFLNPKIPAELTFFNRMFDAGASTLQRAPVCRLGEAVPAWDLAAQSQVSGGATAAKPAPARAAALEPIELPFKNGILQRESFRAALNAQLDSKNKAALIVDKNWSGASVADVRQTYRTVGEEIAAQEEKGVTILFTDLVPPAKQYLLKEALPAGSANDHERAMVALMNEIGFSTLGMNRDALGALVRSDDYGKLEAYIACLAAAADKGIEVRALDPAATPKPGSEQYIILASGTRADVSAASEHAAKRTP
jgi:hypothetical protein